MSKPRYRVVHIPKSMYKYLRYKGAFIDPNKPVCIKVSK